MSKNINAIVLALLTTLYGAATVWASDVYIDQAGSTTTIDITQTGDGTLLVVQVLQAQLSVIILMLILHRLVQATQLILKCPLELADQL